LLTSAVSEIGHRIHITKKKHLRYAYHEWDLADFVVSEQTSFPVGHISGFALAGAG